MRFFKKRTSKLRDMLGGYELPSFPTISMRVLGLLRDPDSEMAEVAEQLQNDPAMLVRVLRTVNAAAYGLHTQISNVNHAVTILGRSRLESIILALSVTDILPVADIPWFDSKRFWSFASLRGNIARQLALRLHAATEVEAFTAGLLQDMAVPLIALAKKESYNAVLDRWGREKDTWLHTLEREAFGFDHTTVGCMMAEEWDMSAYLAEAIADHHKPVGDSRAEPAVMLVSFVRDSDRSEGMDILTSNCREQFGIDPESLSEMLDTATKDAEELAGMLQ